MFQHVNSFGFAMISRSHMSPLRLSHRSLPVQFAKLLLCLLASTAHASPASRKAGPRTQAAHGVNSQAVPVSSAQNSTLIDVHVFGSQAGATPLGALTTDGAGNFYGTTKTGGTYNLGTVFKLGADSTLTILHSFDFIQSGQLTIADGNAPQAGVLLAPDGFLYGTTSAGGTNGYGTIFRLDPATFAFATLANFNAATGSAPAQGLVTDGQDNFYGVTTNGITSAGDTSYGDGTLFVYHADTGMLAPLYNFANDGQHDSAEGPLLLAPDGNLYGTTQEGGVAYTGTVFQVNPATGAHTTLIDLGYTGSFSPVGQIVTDGRGNFYIADREAVYSFTVNAAANPPTATPVLIHSFSYPGPSTLTNGVVFGADGNLYGSSSEGGADDDGAFYQLVLNAPDGNGNTSTANVLYNFPSPFDDASSAPLLPDAAGNFYGVSSNNGPNEVGGVFALNPVAGSTPLRYSATDLHDFLPADGNNATTSLTLGKDGNLYGTTFSGGTSPSAFPGYGSVFVYNPRTGVTTTLYDFTGFYTNDGYGPSGKLIETDPGVFYGTTADGGADDGEGTIYRLIVSTDPAIGVISATYAQLHTFQGITPEGSIPMAGLTAGTDGLFYGTTYGGGDNDNGTLFAYDPAANMVTTLAAFNGSNGRSPAAELTLGSDGNFYGTTFSGGSITDGGTIFQFNPATTTLTTLANFTGTNGQSPTSALLQGADGNFYGTTNEGGDYNYGTLFQLDPATGAVTTLVSFNESIGEEPDGDLVQAADGNFYGTTHFGGTQAAGIAYVYNPNVGTLTVLQNFGGYPGEYPIAGLTLAPDGSFYGTTAGSNAGFGVDLAARPAANAKTTRPTAVPNASSVSPNSLLDAQYDTSIYGAIFRLTVAPAITSVSAAAGTLNVPFSFQVAGTFQPATYAASGLPSGLTVDAASGLISGTPTAAGTFLVNLSATNTGGTGVATLVLTITSPPLMAPVINSATSASTTFGVAFGYQTTATNNPLVFGADGLPTGLSIDAANGIISGTPTQSGTFAVNLRATNSAGTGTAVLTLTVAAAVPTVTVVPLGDGEAVEGGGERQGFISTHRRYQYRPNLAL